MVARWVYDHRIKHYYNGLACEQHQNEPIQPIPDSIETDYRKAVLGNLLYHDTRLSIDNTLSCANCRFDRYLKGDQNAISQIELEGYRLFKDNECVSCHVGVNVVGLSYERLGLTRNYFADRGNKITEDNLGRFKQTKHERDRHRFKVPGLRNILLPYPYFHDGKIVTLEDAIDHINRERFIERRNQQNKSILEYINQGI